MSISISDLIKVNIAIAPNAVAVDGFGPLLFMSQEFKPVAGELPVQTFSSLKEVQARFPTGEIPNAATAWYGQKPTPLKFLVGAILQTIPIPATAATVTGNTAAVLNDLKALTSANMSFYSCGKLVNIDGLDLSAETTLPAITTKIQTALTAATGADSRVTLTQTAGKFVLTTETTGIKATLTMPSGSLSVALKLTSAAGAILVNGEAAKSISVDLANAADSNLNFFYVALERSLRATPSQMDAARWCQASGKVFGWADDDPNILVNGAASSFREAKSAQLQNTLCVFDASENGDEYPEVSILGRAATVNFNAVNSVLILAYKKGPGVTVADLNSGQVAALESVNGNAFISVGGNAMFWNGKMADGTWFDTVQGVEWLSQQIRNNVFNLFYQSTTKIPWTDTGVAMVEQQVTNALELARTNGLIAPGYDNEGTFYPNGYKVVSTPLDLLQSQKGARVWEDTSFIAIGSGAMQGATISGTFVQ